MLHFFQENVFELAQVDRKKDLNSHCIIHVLMLLRI